MTKQNGQLGNDIQKILETMGLFCSLENCIDNEIGTKFEFNLQNLKDYQKLQKAIDVMKICYHKEICLTNSDTYHFAIQILKDNKELKTTKYISNAEQDKYSIILGLDDNGKKVNFNLKNSIHTLIGGATGMGKTNILNNIIYSLSKQNNKDEIEFSLIDIKKTLSIWDGLPQIKGTTAQSPTEALLKLKAISITIEERYEKLAKKKQVKADDNSFKRIVIVIDELADLMLSGLKQYIEDQIVHIAQIGRAVNVHLVIATQSPIAKVCTNLIKANCPTVIALKTVSIPTSRVILDNKNAFELQGVGDCIIRNADYPCEKRFKALYLDEQEILKYVKEKKNEYIQQKKKK